eukprot:352273-Chlamydomonas_euryale.AAC.2
MRPCGHEPCASSSGGVKGGGDGKYKWHCGACTVALTWLGAWSGHGLDELGTSAMLTWMEAWSGHGVMAPAQC